MGNTDTAGTGVTVHPVRKLITPDIARYIKRTVLSSTDKTKYLDGGEDVSGQHSQQQVQESQYIHPVRKFISPDIAR